MKSIICIWLMMLVVGLSSSVLADANRMSREQLYAEYQYWTREAVRQGIDPSYTSFEQYVKWRRMQEAGIDPQAVQRQQMQNQQMWWQNHQGMMRGMDSSNDAQNQDWYQDQQRKDASMDRWSDGYREQGRYTGQNSETMTLPNGVNQGDTYYDGNNSYYFDGYGWYQQQPGGYGTRVYEAPYR